MNQENEEKNRYENIYLESIQTLRNTIEAKDPYTRGHSDRVSEYSVLIGEKMGLSEKDLETLKIGGLFHDIGKIGISDNILRKQTKLSDDEFSEIKHHTEIGTRILSNATVFKEIIPIVKYHHERYDGKGYYGSSSGEEIPLMARITAVADSFDAMNSKRPYRDRLDMSVIKDEISKNRGTQFDPRVADTFLNILENDYDKIKDIENRF